MRARSYRPPHQKATFCSEDGRKRALCRSRKERRPRAGVEHSLTFPTPAPRIIPGLYRRLNSIRAATRTGVRATRRASACLVIAEVRPFAFRTPSPTRLSRALTHDVPVTVRGSVLDSPPQCRDSDPTMSSHQLRDEARYPRRTALGTLSIASKRPVRPGDLRPVSPTLGRAQNGRHTETARAPSRC
jgi:hypothetical protein